MSTLVQHRSNMLSVFFVPLFIVVYLIVLFGISIPLLLIAFTKDFINSKSIQKKREELENLW